MIIQFLIFFLPEGGEIKDLEVMFTDWKNMALASPSNDLVSFL